MTGLEIKKLLHTFAQTKSGVTKVYLTPEAFDALIAYLNESSTSMYGSGPMPTIQIDGLRVHGIKVVRDE